MHVTRHTAVLLGIGVAVLTFALGLRYQQATFTTDAMVYADTARQIAAGEGITSRIVHLDDARVPIPQSNYPALFPLAVAPFIALGLPLQTALKLVPLAAFALGSGALALYLARRFGLLTSVLWALVALTNTTHLRWAAQPLSEGFAMGLSVLALILLTRTLERAARWQSLALGAVTGALAITRVVALGMFPAAFALLLVTRRWRAALWSLLGAVAVAGPFWGMSIANHEFANSHEASTVSLLANAWRTVKLLGLDLLRHPLSIALALALLIAFAILRRAGLRRVREQGAWPLVVASATLGLGLLAATVVARSLITFDDLYTRFTTPAEFLIWPAVAVLVATLVPLLRPRAVVTLLLLLWLGWGTIRVGQLFPTADQLRSRVWNPGTRTAWVDEHIPDDALIIGNRAVAYNFFTGKNALALRKDTTPEQRFEFDQELARWRGVVPSVYLVLEGTIRERNHRQWVVDLSRGVGAKPGDERLDAPTGLVVYRLDFPAQTLGN